MLPIIFTCKELFKPWEANEYFTTNSIKANILFLAI